MTQEGANVRKPIGSNLLKISQDEREVEEVVGFLDGKWVNSTLMALTAPIGRLM
jgi:hypothetical protein